MLIYYIENILHHYGLAVHFYSLFCEFLRTCILRCTLTCILAPLSLVLKINIVLIYTLLWLSLLATWKKICGLFWCRIIIKKKPINFTMCLCVCVMCLCLCIHGREILKQEIYERKEPSLYSTSSFHLINVIYRFRRIINRMFKSSEILKVQIVDIWIKSKTNQLGFFEQYSLAFNILIA